MSPSGESSAVKGTRIYSVTAKGNCESSPSMIGLLYLLYILDSALADSIGPLSCLSAQYLTGIYVCWISDHLGVLLDF